MKNILKLKISESSDYIRSQFKSTPKIGVILGSGLGSFSHFIENPLILSTKEIPHYPLSTVVGHTGQWYIGTLNNIPIIVVLGRVHFYEGYSLYEVTYPIHLLASLGIKILIITTASGGLNPDFQAGDLMLIDDQINFSFNNPLIGRPEQLLGKRFLDMTKCFDPELIYLAEKVGSDKGIFLRKGVFCYVTGPAYETAAEVRMLRLLGGDAISMSTAPEVIIACQRRLRVLGISIITNPATGLSKTKLTHNEVTKSAHFVEDKLNRFLAEVIVRIADYI